MKNIDLNRVYDFLKIVELGNITRAAEALSLPKARLSRNLALLEQDLGVQLAYRTTRQFQLTAAGQSFYKNAKEHFDGIEASILNLKSTDQTLKGPIKVTAPEDVGTYLVTPILSEFHKVFPQVHFEVIYTNEVLDLVKLGVDLAIRLGSLQDSSLKQKKVGHVEMICVAAPEFLNRRLTLEKPESLARLDTICFQNSTVWKLRSLEGARSFKISPVIKSNNYSSIVDFARRGHGVALVPHFLVEADLASGALIHVLKGWTDPGATVQVVYPEQKRMPVRIERFFEFLSIRMKAKLG